MPYKNKRSLAVLLDSDDELEEQALGSKAMSNQTRPTPIAVPQPSRQTSTPSSQQGRPNAVVVLKNGSPRSANVPQQGRSHSVVMPKGGPSSLKDLSSQPTSSTAVIPQQAPVNTTTTTRKPSTVQATKLPDVAKEDIFAEDGDVLVVIGPDTGKRTFKVDMAIMRAVSDKWREFLRSRQTQAQIELTGVDGDAFAIAMKAAYHRYEELPERLTDAQLYSLIKMYTKYELTRILSRHIQRWTKDFDARSVIARLAISWCLKMKLEFFKAWDELVLHTWINESGEMFFRDDGKTPLRIHTGFLQPAVSASLIDFRKRALIKMSHSFEHIMTTLISTYDPNDIGTGEENENRALFNRLLWTAHDEGMLSKAFPLTFVKGIPYDQHKITLAEFAMEIWKKLPPFKVSIGGNFSANMLVKLSLDGPKPQDVTDHFQEAAAEPAKKKPKVG